MPRKFVAKTVESLKPAAVRQDHHDSEVRGLALRITPAGIRTWSLRYRHRGILRRLTLGRADVLSLAEARSRARDALHQVSEGIDPATVKQADQAAPLISDLINTYLERHAKKHKRSWREDRRILHRDVLPAWRHRAVTEVTRRDVRLLVESIADRGAPIMANRSLAVISKVFRFAVDDELLDTSPAVRIPKPGREQQRDRVLSEAEIRQLWAAFDDLPAAMAAWFKLRLVLAQRGGELAQLRWTDVQDGWLVIPAAVAKNGLAHRVPVTSLAREILDTLPRDTDFVLQGARGRRQQSEAAQAFAVPDFKGHDLRRTAASYMAAGGVPRLVISKILNHVETSVTAVYDRHSYDAEKQAALAWWDQKLRGILAETSGRVLPFARSAS